VAELTNAEKKQRAVLLILLATCKRALEAFQVADNQVDEEFVGDLEKIMSRTERELATFAAKVADAT
jgi:hypothetical protein